MKTLTFEFAFSCFSKNQIQGFIMSLAFRRRSKKLKMWCMSGGWVDGENVPFNVAEVNYIIFLWSYKQLEQEIVLHQESSSLLFFFVLVTFPRDSFSQWCLPVVLVGTYSSKLSCSLSPSAYDWEAHLGGVFICDLCTIQFF